MSRARDTAGIIQYNKISIDSNNAVGIGSSIPDCKLDINGGMRVVGVSTFENNAIFDGSSTLISGDNKLNFNTNSGQEGQLYATSEYFYINSSASTGMYIQGAGFVNIRSNTGEDMFRGTANGSVQLYFDDVAKLDTTGGGITISGIATCDGISMGDDEEAIFGTGGDLRIFHSGNVNIIDTPTSRSIQIKGNGITLRSQANENYVQCVENGAVELFHNNNKKIETTGGGISVTGVCTATSFAGSGANLTDLNIPASFNDLDAALFS
jgi:hypothetical protein